MDESVWVVLTTWPDAERARAAASLVVQEGLAACGNLVPGVESIYRWKGTVETAQEILVIFKTTARCYPALEKRLRTLHPYEVPEIVAFPPNAGLPAYMDWVRDSCAPEVT